MSAFFRLFRFWMFFRRFRLPKRFHLLLVVTGCAFLCGACSTLESRVEKNRDYVDSLPEAAQTRIRSGQIDLGFTAPMVQIALGDPQQRHLRRTAGGDIESWIYTEASASYTRQRADIDGLSLSGGGRVSGGSAWVTFAENREEFRMRVEFRNGRVIAIEVPAEDVKKLPAPVSAAPVTAPVSAPRPAVAAPSPSVAPSTPMTSPAPAVRP